MARARKVEGPKPEILRTVRLDGEEYGPGDEEALKEHYESLDTDGDDETDAYDHTEDLKRLQSLGFLVNFIEMDDEEAEQYGENSNSDIRASRQAIVQTREKAAGTRRGRGKAKKFTETDEAQGEEGNEE